ncbi:MAG: hypothetical protein RIR31_769, partial [Bacteroidota bacterium]
MFLNYLYNKFKLKLQNRRVVLRLFLLP